MNFSQVAIRSERLALNAYQLLDCIEAFPLVTPGITRFMSFEPAVSPRAFANECMQWLPKMARGTDLILTVRLASSGELLGICGVHSIGLGKREIDFPEPEVGIWIRQDAHGQGYGREAVVAALAWLATACGIDAVIYPVASANLPSRRIPESLEAEVIGKRELHKPDGQVHTMLVYRIATAKCT